MVLKRRIKKEEIESIRPTDEELDKFQEGLQDLRIDLGYTQTEIADVLGVSPSCYSNLERGLISMSVTYYYAIYAVYARLDRNLSVVNNSELEDFRLRLPKTRNAFGISKTNMADFLGMSYKGYTRLEDELGSMSARHYYAINAAINVISSYLHG